MRQYNFDVRFTEPDSFDILCRIRLARRFDARYVIDDFPRNVADGYLNRLLKKPSAPNFTYRTGSDNSVDILMSGETRSVSDGERAVLLNLIEFGQDFESELSTTIEVVEFPVKDPGSYTVERLLTALQAENDAARIIVNDLMMQYPSEDGDSAKEWPEEYHDRYFYQVRLEFETDIASGDVVEFKDALETLYRMNMWNGYSTDTSAENAVQSGRTGLSYEIEVGARLISYLVERPACDPALSIVWLWKMAEQKIGHPAQSSEIFVTSED